MLMPGFTAEASLYTSGNYRTRRNRRGINSSAQAVGPINPAMRAEETINVHS